MPVRSINPKAPPKPVLSMPGENGPHHDWVAILIVVMVIIAFAGSGIYLLNNLSLNSISKPMESITRFIETLPSLDFLEKKFRKIPLQPRVQEVRKDRLLVRQGYDLYMKNNFEQAIAVFQEAIAVNPENPEAYYWRGRALIKMEKIDPAIDDFKKALTLRPDHSDACDNLGWLYMRKGDYGTSITYLNRSIELKPENSWAYYNRGFVYSKKGETAKALADAEKACGLGYEKGCEMAKRYRKK
ncbi:MAG: tetratricopeptide repeat protein [Thermodesulfobacteriota bacterium]